MTFLNPSILWGLFALAVPIIVHFFNLQRPKTILFSNVAFVKEIKREVTRRIKLRQWLLLAARMLAITGLVLAFANPVWKTSSNKILNGNRSVAIVIDNSQSMLAGNEKGEYLKQATSLAKSIVQSYSQQDEILLTTTGNLQLNSNFGEKQEVLEQLPKLDVRQRVVSQNTILNSCSELFARASNRVREVYFLSDFQNSTVLSDSQQIKLAFDSTLMVKMIPLASREQNNVYIRDHKIASQIMEANKPIQMSLTLVNDGETPVKELGIRVMIAGKVAAIATQSIAAKATATVNLSFTASGTGWQSGQIELEDRPIEFDNLRYFSFYIPDQEKILVIEGQSSPYIKILYQDLFKGFTPTFLNIKQLSTVQFSEYRAVVISGLEEMSSGLAERIQMYLKEGGSIMLFPGANMELSTVNPFLQGLGVGQFSEMVEVQNGVKASQPDLSHPVFEGVFQGNQQNRQFDAPIVYRYYPLLTSGSAIMSRVLSLENQNSIFTQARVGEGTLFLWSIFPGDAWSDIPVKTIFTPMMFRATQLMTRSEMENINQELGAFRPVTVQTQSQEVIKLIGEKNEYIPEQYNQAGATVLNFNKLDIKAGNYRVMQGDQELDRLSFNISDIESKLAFTDLETLTEKYSDMGLKNVTVLPPQPYNIQAQIQTEKEGTPLWKYFVIAGLLFLIAEIFILRVKA